MSEAEQREAFEAWFRSTWKPEPGNFDAMADFWFDRIDDGGYEITRIEDCWTGWRAAYESLQAENARLTSEVARLREALLEYGYHSPVCAKRLKGCNCGYSAALGVKPCS